MELDVQKQVEKWTLESALVVPALTDGHSRADLPRLGDKRWAKVSGSGDHAGRHFTLEGS